MIFHREYTFIRIKDCWQSMEFNSKLIEPHTSISTTYFLISLLTKIKVSILCNYLSTNVSTRVDCPGKSN